MRTATPPHLPPAPTMSSRWGSRAFFRVEETLLKYYVLCAHWNPACLGLGRKGQATAFGNTQSIS